MLSLSQMPEQSIPLRWSAYEHNHVERGGDWYWALAIFAICAALTSILFQNFLFALLILVAAGTVALVVREPLELINFELSDKGIRIQEKLHRYDEIISFWVEEEHHDGRPLLLVDTKKILSPNFIIPIEEIDPALVRAFLKERTTEKHMKEPIAHKLFEFFGI